MPNARLMTKPACVRFSAGDLSSRHDLHVGTKAALNVNGDDAAAVIAAALGAELWLVADVPGVMDENRIRHSMSSINGADALVSDGTVNRGMHAKLEAGFIALAAGAASVRIARTRSAFRKGKRNAVVSNTEHDMTDTLIDRNVVQASREILGTYKRAPMRFVRGAGVELFDETGQGISGFVERHRSQCAWVWRCGHGAYDRRGARARA